MQLQALPRLILLMGVAGSGKTTLGRLLAAKLAYAFVDADDYHDAEAVALMRSGRHLTDAMRDAWIERVQVKLMGLYRAGTSCVLAFSGLRARHRQQLMHLGFDTTAFMLTADTALLERRIAARSDHFMPASQLPHQLGTMEAPQADERIEWIDIQASPENIVSTLAAQLITRGQSPH